MGPHLSIETLTNRTALLLVKDDYRRLSSISYFVCHQQYSGWGGDIFIPSLHEKDVTGKNAFNLICCINLINYSANVTMLKR